VHALERISIQGVASTPPRDSGSVASARASYLARFPEAEPMTALGDFRLSASRRKAARIAQASARRAMWTSTIIAALNPAA
jgi:putative heme iron utilization protein